MNVMNPRHVSPAWISNAAAFSYFPVVSSPGSRAAEAFRGLQSQVYLNWLNKAGGGTVFAVVSPDRGEGRSFVASNLAVMFAQSGSRCLLIDADMRFPSIRTLFDLPNDDGLSSLLRDSEEIEPYYCAYSMQGLENLNVIPAGPVPQNPLALLQRPSFLKLVEFSAQSHDVVIIDTPAGKLFDDAQLITRATRGALLVCRKNVTRTARASTYIRQLSSLGVQTIGATVSGM
jgi:protein-tyrosine kinase